MRKTAVLQTIIFASVLLSLVFTALIFLVEKTTSLITVSKTFYVFFLLGSTVLFSFGFYFLIYNIFNEKINVIYRIIYNTKNPGKGKKMSLSNDSLEEALEEVSDWSKTENAELQKMKEKEAFSREFIGNVSHELKTPVFTVQGYLLTLLDGGLEDDSINRKFLERAYNGVDRMTKIIEDLDVITRIESGSLELNETTFDLIELAKELMEELEILAKDKSISIKFGKEPTTAIKVKADKSKIAQVLTNLINNAISYGKENGEIILRFIPVGKDILVEVADNGDGISEEHLTRLFERFYRVDQSRDRNKGGSGLGLAIVKHIIESHGHSVNVRSTVGIGSTFSFTLSRVK